MAFGAIKKTIPINNKKLSAAKSTWDAAGYKLENVPEYCSRSCNKETSFLDCFDNYATKLLVVKALSRFGRIGHYLEQL